MVTKVVPGLLIATENAAQAASEACARMSRILIEAIRERGTATMALSGGSSPLEAYRLLAHEPIDWSRVHVFWVDDRAVPPTHERSNFAQAKRVFLDAIAIPVAQVHRMPGEAVDLDQAAAAYETEVRAHVKSSSLMSAVDGVPSFDLQVLGIGTDGHTASLFPGEPTVHVTDKLVAAVPAAEGREARLTLTAPVLEHAKATLILVLGKDKHAPLERIWATHGTLDETPGRVTRAFRGSVCWIIDRAAGSGRSSFS